MSDPETRDQKMFMKVLGQKKINGDENHVYEFPRWREPRDQKFKMGNE